VSSHIFCDKWRKRAAPLDPATIHFTAVEALQRDDCLGCIFETQRVAVCDQAELVAKEKDLPACSPRTGQTFIYVLDRVSDPRQRRIKNTTKEDNDH